MKVVINDIVYVEQPPVVQDRSLTSALSIRFNSDAGDNLTVRDYFYNLLRTLWIEEEGFSGKRPFGNSGWQYDIYNALDECDDIPEDTEYDPLIYAAIAAL